MSTNDVDPRRSEPDGEVAQVVAPLAERVRKRHKEQERYRGQATPNKGNHRTGSVTVCAHCSRPWPCDAFLLATALLAEHPAAPSPEELQAVEDGFDAPVLDDDDAAAEAEYLKPIRPSDLRMGGVNIDASDG